MWFMLKSGKVLTRNKKMANALAKRGKAIRTHSGRFKRQNTTHGQAKVVSDGHESSS